MALDVATAPPTGGDGYIDIRYAGKRRGQHRKNIAPEDFSDFSNFEDFVHRSPWPSLPTTRCLTARTATSVINRYYDPATGEFLSVDPDVATTDQPYVFTNDDPLNTTDPLGMEALKSVVDQDDAAAKRCKDNPKADGCRGNDVVGDVGSFVKNNIGTISSGVAVAGLFIPGVDIADVAIFAGVGVASRVTQRSLDDHSSPLSSKNLGANLLDLGVSSIGLGLVSVPGLAGEGVLSSMSPASAALLKARLGIPELFELGIDQTMRSRH
jgi:hypothetical protein